MDEEKDLRENNIDLKTKESVENQLNSFINNEKPKIDAVNAADYYSGTETKVQPLIKVADISIPENLPKQNRPIIRTYKSDVEETIQTNHISSINIALAENKKMLAQAKSAEIDEKRVGINKNILIISSVLVVGGLLTFLIPKLLIQSQFGTKNTQTQTVSSRSLMAVDLEEKINIQDIDLSRVATTLKERVDESATRLGQIENIYLTEGTGTAETLITSAKFLQLIEASVPLEIQRTLEDPYMFGLYNYNGNQRFLILKVSEYDTTFEGMFSWETTLWQDFKEIFELPADNSASSSSSYGIGIEKFQDETFDNKDCRVVKDSSGNIVFLYSIIDQNTVVITTSKDTLTEIINRISKAKVITQ